MSQVDRTQVVLQNAAEVFRGKFSKFGWRLFASESQLKILECGLPVASVQPPCNSADRAAQFCSPLKGQGLNSGDNDANTRSQYPKNSIHKRIYLKQICRTQSWKSCAPPMMRI